MVAAPTPHTRVAIRCDATTRSGVGHLVRQVALAEELVGRGHGVRFVGDLEVPWARKQVSDRGFRLDAVPPGPLGAALAASGVNAVVIDGYEIAADAGRTCRVSGLGVLTMVDGPFGLHQDADVYVDQNLGAAAPPDARPGAEFLLGLDYVLLRDLVRERRDRAQRRLAPGEPPRVLVVFGGTDPYEGAPVLVPMLLDADVPVEVLAIAARPEVAAHLDGLERAAGQTVTVLPPTDDLPGVAASCDAVVSASGTSVWEMLCLGLPLGLVCVTENQVLGYREATRELCLPVGQLGPLRADAAARRAGVAELRRLLTDAGLRERLAARGRALVDGRGRERVADAVERLALR